MGTNTYGYAYDPIGNRLTCSHNAETNSYTANNLNQYTAIDDAEPTYDADGNMTGDGRGWHYVWNGENRMVCASNDDVCVTYAYDHRGRMVRKEIARTGSDPQGIAYTWDDWNIIQETTADLSTLQPFNLSTSSYVWGLDIDGTLQGAGGVGGLLAVIREDGVYIPAYDANGNITEYVATDGEIVAYYDYSPFGETLVAFGPLVSTFTHRFSTKFHDNNSGLGYWGYRWYESQMGRWMSRDPLQEQGGVSLFAFANNSAILYYDSLGESIGDIWDFLKKYANPYEIYQQLKNIYGKFRNVACPKIKALQNTDIVNCGCALIAVADVGSSSPLVERVDCLCNVLSSFGQMCDTGISSWQFWAYSALTTLDCASAPVAIVLGGLVGEAAYPAGGGVIGAIIGATPAGDAAVDVAAMALQNMVTQGTPLPMSQGKSCCNLIMNAASELWGFEDSAGCECQKYSNP